MFMYSSAASDDLNVTLYFKLDFATLFAFLAQSYPPIRLEPDHTKNLER
jgi:hypothetical protein